MEAELVAHAGFSFSSIPAAGVHGVGIRALPGNILRLLRGFTTSRKIIKDFRPDVMFFTGGYIAVPMAVAGWLPMRKVPRPKSMVYVPDIEPGLALKTLIRFANHTTVTTEGTRKYLPRRSTVTVTGYPVRSELKSWNKVDARQALGLTSDLPVLLVTGGSSGARSINRALLSILQQLINEMQVVHVTGKLDWPDVLKIRQVLESSSKLDPHLVVRYHAYAYLHEEMGAAMSAADLVVSRAGASSLGEYPFFGLPAILIPYPHAWKYQRVNAQYLVDRGAAAMIPDEELSTRLLPAIREMLLDADRLGKMRAAMLSLAKPDAARDIAIVICSLAGNDSDQRM